MTTVQFLTAVHIIFSVGIGLLVGRYARPIVRKMVVAAMPMQQRMKENFLRRLGLIAGSITIGLAMLSAGFVHLSSAKWFRPGRNQSHSATEPLAPRLTLDRPEQPYVEVEETPPTDLNSDNNNTALPARRQALALNPLVGGGTQGFDPQGSYLQLEAFDGLPNAQRSAEHWQHFGYAQRPQQGHPIWIARANHGPAIYKVLLGPFQHLDAVRQYRNQQGLPGFARSGEGLSEVQY
ncbi:SPOR domain-containing protein [Haliscomenobacter sp.]|uniref:SPOR domain-containing protein n=1 Tax=Haliscomenobacter sp. TaxID=2717303 RepID=UPI0035931D32